MIDKNKKNIMVKKLFQEYKWWFIIDRTDQRKGKENKLDILIWI